MAAVVVRRKARCSGPLVEPNVLFDPSLPAVPFLPHVLFCYPLPLPSSPLISTYFSLLDHLSITSYCFPPRAVSSSLSLTLSFFIFNSLSVYAYRSVCLSLFMHSSTALYTPFFHQFLLIFVLPVSNPCVSFLFLRERQNLHHPSPESHI